MSQPIVGKVVLLAGHSATTGRSISEIKWGERKLSAEARKSEALLAENLKLRRALQMILMQTPAHGIFYGAQVRTIAREALK